MAEAELLTCINTCSDKLDAQIVSGCGVSSSDEQAIPCVCASNDLKTALESCMSQTCADKASDAELVFDKLCEVTAADAIAPITDCIGTCSTDAQPSCPAGANGDDLIACVCTNDTVRDAYNFCTMQTCQDIYINAIASTNILCASRFVNDTAPTKDKDSSGSSIPLTSRMSWIAALAAVAVTACL